MAVGAPKPRHTYLKARFQIGSCKGPTQYGAAEAVFHPDDIPAASKAAKASAIKWARGGTDYGEKSLWNNSAATGVKRFGLRTRINADHDRARYAYNYRAESLPPKNFEPIPKTHKFKVDDMPEARKQTIRDAAISDPSYLFKTCNMEMPVSTKLVGKPRWNIEQFCSGLAEHEKIREDKQHAMLRSARANTAKVSQRLDGYTTVAKLPLPRPLLRPLPGPLPRLLLGRKPPKRLALAFFAAGTLWTAARTDSAVGAAASKRPLSRAFLSRDANASSAPCPSGASMSFACSLRCTVEGPPRRSRAAPSAIQGASRPFVATSLCVCSIFPLVPTGRS